MIYRIVMMRIIISCLTKKESVLRLKLKKKKINDSNQKIFSGGDFFELITKSTIWLDRTMFVKQIMKDSSKVILLNMPRRWEKSQNLDMLRGFLSIPVDKEGNKIKKEETDNYKLSAGGKIKVIQGSKEIDKVLPKSKLVVNHPEILNLQGEYPVIYLDSNDCEGEKFQKVRETLQYTIIETLESFDYLASKKEIFSCTTSIGEEFVEIFKEANSSLFEFAIRRLSGLLHSYYEKKVWILIDEYDAAPNTAYFKFSKEESEEVESLFKDFYKSTFKDNPALDKGVITGIQPILKYGVGSGLNNVSIKNSISPTYSKYYGIDQDEMKLLIEHFNIDGENALRIKDWYIGYLSNYGSTVNPDFRSKYNIWSVVNYLNNQKCGFQSYWENSNLTRIFHRTLITNQKVRCVIEDLINNKNFYMQHLTTNFGIEDFFL